MKKTAILVPVCAVALFLAACRSEPATPVPSAGPQPAAATTRPYTSAVGGFSVNAPVMLNESVDLANTAIGSLEVHTFQGAAGNTDYAVTYTEYPQGYKSKTAQQMLDNARAGQVKAVNGTLVTSRAITLSGYAGQEVQIRMSGAGGPERMLRGRIYWVGTRLYSVLVYTPVAQTDDPAVVAFLDSFQLRDRAQ